MSYLKFTTYFFKTFLSIIPHVIDAKFPILTRGRHGIGKSTVVYQIANNLGLEVVERISLDESTEHGQGGESQ